MRIENLGLPGSGKSTLSTRCRKQLARLGHVSIDSSALAKVDAANAPSDARLWQQSRWRQNYHLARFLSEHPNLQALFGELYGANFRNLSLTLDVGADLSRYQMQSDHLHSFWVDEGFFHLGCHALLEASEWDFPACLMHLDRFMETVPLPDAILHTDASVETATTGIFARLEGKSKDVANRRFNKAFGGSKGMDARASLIKVMVERLKAAGARIIAVKAHYDLDALCDEVLAELGTS
jgi:hypothetical protein